MIRLTLRLPDKVHSALKALAKKENRSLNGQIVHIIKQWLSENTSTFQTEKES